MSSFKEINKRLAAMKNMFGGGKADIQDLKNQLNVTREGLVLICPVHKVPMVWHESVSTLKHDGSGYDFIAYLSCPNGCGLKVRDHKKLKEIVYKLKEELWHEKEG